MRTPEEIEKAAACCFDAEDCKGCPYIKSRCADVTTSSELIDDMITLIARLQTTINLMKIQMRGDCGSCKHKDDPKICGHCIIDVTRPCWEYEGLPELPKKGEY